MPPFFEIKFTFFLGMYFSPAPRPLLVRGQFPNFQQGGITMIRTLGTRILPVLSAVVWLAHPALCQDKGPTAAERSATLQSAAHAEAQSESRVSAEMVKGKLNPATSKPGDEIAVRLKDDVKSDGQVLLKKGSTIKGVVKKVQRADKGNAKATGSAQSMMELEWIAPGVSGAAAQSLNLALQSVVYTNPLYAHQEESSSNSTFASAAPAAAPRSSSGGGLGAGAVGGVATGIVGGAASSVGAVGGIGNQTTASVGTVTQSQTNLARPPAILPVTTEASANLQNSFGVSGGSLFHVGSGSAISSGGTATSMDIFSHMSNDAVITSPSRDFEIASGAQMQLLIQGSAKK
jgi:hypothetical protein